MLLSRFTVLLGALLAPISFAFAQSNNDLNWIPFDREQFDGNATLDTNGNVQLFWKTGDNYSTFGIASRSSGYLALGFSQTGAMTGADMAVGYTDQNGEFVFENRHAAGFITPQMSEDQEKNMRLKEHHQADNVTAFVFEKQNKADCLQDQADVGAWQWFIYEHSQENTFAQHGPGENGKSYIKLNKGKTVSVNVVRDIPDSKSFTVQQPEVTIPTAETTYCYSAHKLPAGKRNYLVGEQPTESSKLLHHLVLYGCYNPTDELKDMVGKEPNCNWETFSNPCNSFVTEWAPGMSGRTFEKGYGKPFGSDLYEYVMFETHYNNPTGIEGMKDKAAYTLKYTDQKVENEIGTLTLGDLQVAGWFVDPGKELVAHSTVCTPECTGRWRSEGITAVSVFHHMHFRGRNARVQIIRDGKEIAPLSTLRNFEYGYQFSKSLEEIKLLPGDKFITTCEYNTMNDTKPVAGGPSSAQEMCFAWVDYYPANDVLACTQMDMGNSPENPVNGTSALCLTAEAPDLYKSAALTSTFQNLTTSGDMCPASDGPGTTTPGTGDAAVLSTCPGNDVCFSINVPQQSASSGSGDIFFQLSAPTTYSWVALAQGTAMNNANMFLMHSSADGTNVTLSARNTSGHIMPTHNSAADVYLMEGSGISNGKMTANVRCANCNSWSTGSMSLKDSTSDWLYAYRSGSPVNSDDTNAVISQHDRNGNFQWDLSRATGGSSANPFTASATTTTNSSSSSNEWDRMSPQSQSRFAQTHGALATIAFVAIFPVGAILVRLASFSGLAWIHGGLQIFGYLLFIVAAGIGIYIANASDRLDEPHAVIGLLLFAVLFFMPIVGTVHHRMYKKVQRRTFWSYGHIFTGRVGIILGMINGGLGLQLADAGRSSLVAYGVIAGLVGVAYLGTILFGEFRRGKRSSQTVLNHAETKQREREGSGRDTSEEHSLS
jgi:hypothetical protein